jgi:hypothetical protein
MPIYRLLQNSAFEPEHLSAMATAFEQALADLNLVDRSDPLTEVIARKVIEIAQCGERDPIRLCEQTVAAFSDLNGGTALRAQRGQQRSPP